MKNNLQSATEGTPSAAAPAATPSRPRLTVEGRAAVRDAACARYEAGQYLTFDQFVAKHEKR